MDTLQDSFPMGTRPAWDLCFVRTILALAIVMRKYQCFDIRHTLEPQQPKVREEGRHHWNKHHVLVPSQIDKPIVRDRDCWEAFINLYSKFVSAFLRAVARNRRILNLQDKKQIEMRDFRWIRTKGRRGWPANFRWVSQRSILHLIQKGLQLGFGDLRQRRRLSAGKCGDSISP